jgi:hypothetical protein
MQSNIATVEILVDDNGSDTRAVARLRANDAPGMIGTGLAHHSLGDARQPESNEKLATARALADLADQLFQVVDSADVLPTGWSY